MSSFAGFIKKLWRTSKKTVKTLTKLDAEIRTKIDILVKMCQLSQHEGVETLLREFCQKRPNFAVERKMEELIKQRMAEEGEDEETAREALSEDRIANAAVQAAGGISEEVFREEMAELKTGLAEIKSLIQGSHPDDGCYIRLEVHTRIMPTISRRFLG